MDRPELVLGCASARWRKAYTKSTGKQLRKGQSAGSIDCHLGPGPVTIEQQEQEQEQEQQGLQPTRVPEPEGLVAHRHAAISWDMHRQCFKVGTHMRTCTHAFAQAHAHRRDGSCRFLATASFVALKLTCEPLACPLSYL